MITILHQPPKNEAQVLETYVTNSAIHWKVFMRQNIVH